MFKHYLLHAYRTLLKEKVYAFINLIGLSLAIACCLILVLYVRSELTYDQYHENHGQIYKINQDHTMGGNLVPYAITSAALGPYFFREYPWVGDFVRLRDTFVDNELFRSEDRELYWDDVWMADDNVFDVFTHEVIYGDLEGALVDPYTMVISESFSRAYFGDENPVGRRLSTDVTDYTVVAVFRDFPDNVHLKYSALISWNLNDTVGRPDSTRAPRTLFGQAPNTYFHVTADISQQELQELLDDFYENLMAEIGEGLGREIKYHPVPLLDVHFDNSFTRGPPTGNIFYVYGFIAVAIFIMLVACINYANLAIARGTKRAKEIGMRKMLGASRGQLVSQFIAESVVYALLALLVGLLLVEFAEQYTPLADWLGKSQLMDFGSETVLIGWITVGTLLIGLVSGAYPAFYLSFMEPLTAVSSNKQPKGSATQTRQVLTFIQFLVSVSVVASTLLMLLQMEYMTNKPLGYSIEDKIRIKLRGIEMIEKVPLIRSELMTDSSVLGAVDTYFVPGNNAGNGFRTFEGPTGQPPIPMVVAFLYGGFDFLDVMGIDLLEGRNYSESIPTDYEQALLVNQSLVDAMGWENPIGKQVTTPTNTSFVIGVVNDFHIASLHDPIRPLIISSIQYDYDIDFRALDIAMSELVIRISTENIPRTIAHIESVMRRMDPEHPFEYQFFDNAIAEQYANETQLMTLTGMFAVICIVISSLGLFGLTAFTTQQRTKEIGIRKVLGATTAQIIMFLAQFQMLLVAGAAIAASLVSYAVIDNWLSSFAYRIDIPLWAFLAAGVGVGAIAFLTIALQSMKTARSNPVEALRYE